jgi:hypothetical protein
MGVARHIASSQPNNSPIGKLPTLPRNNLATGRLNGAKPIIAPQSTTATKVADAEPRPPGRTEPGHDFGDRHPVDAIHEVDEIDQPNAPNERQRAVQLSGDGGYNAHLMWKSGDDGGKRRSLQHEAGEGPQANAHRLSRQRGRARRQVASWMRVSMAARTAFDGLISGALICSSPISVLRIRLRRLRYDQRISRTSMGNWAQLTIFVPPVLLPRFFWG